MSIHGEVSEAETLAGMHSFLLDIILRELMDIRKVNWEEFLYEASMTNAQVFQYAAGIAGNSDQWECLRGS